MSSTQYGMYVSGTSALAYEAPTLRLVPGSLHSVEPATLALSQATSPKASSTRSLARKHEQATHTFGMTVAIIAIALCMIGAWLFSAHAAEAYVAERTAAVAETTEIVRTGEGLYALAAAHPIEGLSTAQTAEWISQRNNLSTSMLNIGQELVVPRS